MRNFQTEFGQVNDLNALNNQCIKSAKEFDFADLYNVISVGSQVKVRAVIRAINSMHSKYYLNIECSSSQLMGAYYLCKALIHFREDSKFSDLKIDVALKSLTPLFVKALIENLLHHSSEVSASLYYLIQFKKNINEGNKLILKRITELDYIDKNIRDRIRLELLQEES